MRQETIDGKLLFAKTALGNARSVVPVNESLALFGYDNTKLDQGMALYTSTHELHERQKREYGEQFEATDVLNVSRAELKVSYMRHLKLARIALKGNRNAEESMQMRGRRKDSLSGMLTQASAFYANALSSPEVMEAFARFNVTMEVLEAGKAKVEEVQTHYNAQLKETGEAQQATLERDVALDQLDEWMGDFTGVVRIALESQPQYLEILGIVTA